MCDRNSDPSQIDPSEQGLLDYAEQFGKAFQKIMNNSAQIELDVMNIELSDREVDLDWANFKNSFGSPCHTINGDDDWGYMHNRAREKANALRSNAYSKLFRVAL